MAPLYLLNTLHYEQLRRFEFGVVLIRHYRYICESGAMQTPGSSPFTLL